MTPGPTNPETLVKEVAALRRRVALLEAGSDVAYLDAMDRINRVLIGQTDLRVMLVALLDEVLAIFGCDRAWLLFPCDPGAKTWSVPMERTTPEYPGALALDVAVPMDEATRQVFQDALDHDVALPYDGSTQRCVPQELATAFHIKTQMLFALRPPSGAAWLLGIHHCAQHHTFTDLEQRLFSAIGRRAADSLGTLVLLEDLTRSEARYRTLVEHAPDAIVVLDPAGAVLDINDNAQRLFGVARDQLLGVQLSDFAPPSQPDGRPSVGLLQAFLLEAMSGWSPRFEWNVRRADQEERATEVRLVKLDDGGQPRIRASILDLSERRSLELQVQHLQKMKAVGELAGSVAHDLNNQLVVILCYAEMLGDGHDQVSVAELAERVVRAASDASTLTSQLLALSRRSNEALVPVDLDAMVEETGEVLVRMCAPRVTVELQRAPGPVLAMADRQVLEQVLINLVSNARDASPDGETITVRSGRMQLTAESAGALGLAPGTFASLSVIDHGSGMDWATRARVFEPFFTTKPRGEGTGLGLSTARAVAQRLGGSIAVDSAPGEGSTFTLLLAVAGEDAAVMPSRPVPSSDAPGGHERILLVEEHPAVREVALQVLQSGGYDVTVVSSADAALAAPTRPAFDLLLSEVLLGPVDGVSLARELRRTQPDLAVLFATSFGVQSIEPLTHTKERFSLLQKPFSPDGLLRRVRRVLDGQTVQT